MIINASCASKLPADFPKPPGIIVCAPVFKPESNVLSHWTCENSETRERFKAQPKYVQLGIPVETWNEGQSYRRQVESWVIDRCPSTPPKQK